MFDFADATCDLKTAAQTFEPDGMLQVLTLFDALPQAMTTIADTFRILAERADAELPLDRTVGEALNDVFHNLQQTISSCEEVPATMRRAHEHDIRRLEDPRNGEDMWDTRNNDSGSARRTSPRRPARPETAPPAREPSVEPVEYIGDGLWSNGYRSDGSGGSGWFSKPTQEQGWDLPEDEAHRGWERYAWSIALTDPEGGVMVTWSGRSIYPPGMPERERADAVAAHTIANSELPLSIRHGLRWDVQFTPYGVVA